MLASVFESINTTRIDNLLIARNYYYLFLNYCLKFDLIPISSPEFAELSRYFVDDRDEDDVKEERFINWLKNVPRDLKIDRMKRIISRKQLAPVAEESLMSSDQEIDNRSVEAQNESWKNIIYCYVLISVDKLGLLLREMELLEVGEGNVRSDNVFEKAQSDKVTRVEKPFKLVKDRKSVFEGVFRHSHNLPTMTIDEYLELERKRGNIISGGGASSAVKKEVDEDNEMEVDRALMKAREFDEFKDSSSLIPSGFCIINFVLVYARGSGNTYNRS